MEIIFAGIYKDYYKTKLFRKFKERKNVFSIVKDGELYWFRLRRNKKIHSVLIDIHNKERIHKLYSFLIENVRQFDNYFLMGDELINGFNFFNSSKLHDDYCIGIDYLDKKNKNNIEFYLTPFQKGKLIEILRKEFGFM